MSLTLTIDMIVQHTVAMEADRPLPSSCVPEYVAVVLDFPVALSTLGIRAKTKSAIVAGARRTGEAKTSLAHGGGCSGIETLKVGRRSAQ